MNLSIHNISNYDKGSHVTQSFFRVVSYINCNFTLSTMEEQFNELVNNLSSTMEADIFLFSAAVDNHNADHLIQAAREIPNRQKNVVLILTTYGGDAGAAFRIMRFLQRKYEKVILFVFGYCKSAETLMALAADEIVMSDFGEFGPLDVQVFKSDEL